MGYGYTCDGCGDEHPSSPPPFMGEFRESFLKTSGGKLGQKFSIGQTITLCQECCEEYLL